MLLAVDIGNSNIKFGVFDGDTLVSKFSLPTYSHFADDLTARLDSPIDSAIICSVVPEVNGPLADVLFDELGIKPDIVSNDVDLGLHVRHTPLETLGTDRLINAFSAAAKYGGPCIVCSFGTASTFDAVDEKRVLLGGVIAPGMALMAKALKLNTAKLPEVEIQKPENVIGKTTAEAIRSGVFYGYIGLVEGILARLKDEAGDDAKVIATGGFAPLIAKNTGAIDIVDEDLLLDGLRRVHGRTSPV